jgi:glyoxylase-like metal-dependent hydrolase (beta-lactamase superfamily II)
MEPLSLSNASFEGDNNVYLFADRPETVLLDTGDWMAETEAALAAGLDDRGLDFADGDRILLFHWHHDHTGLAATIQANGGTTVLVHLADAPAGEWDKGEMATIHSQQLAYFEA